MTETAQSRGESGAPIRRALISVSDKDGLDGFAVALAGRGVELLSTGGTYRRLRDLGLAVTEVSDFTGFPEIMAGRVKTLHPKIHGGILGRAGTDTPVMEDLGIQSIDLVVVNLYPFERAVADPDCTLETAMENIDIGGPTLLRAAAKNHGRVTAVTDSQDYGPVLDAMDAVAGAVPLSLRRRLAVKAFERTARYEDAIADYLGRLSGEDGKVDSGAFANTFNCQYAKRQDMRYGENPHQRAAFYVETEPPAATLALAIQVQGKALSYNNVADTDAALEAVKAFSARPTCVIVKHANPCGIASATTLEEAYRRAFATDPVSAFGGILAFNRELDGQTARAVLENQFVEVIVAPTVSDEARDTLARKKNVRVLATGELPQTPAAGLDFKRVAGGLLVQDRDTDTLARADLQVAGQRVPEESELRDLLFAWRVVRHVKSNAIVYACGGATVGIGAGQMSRVDSARIATMKAEDAGLEVAGSVMASDAFFPFRDGIDAAAGAGIRAVIQPGGSRRDKEVIQAADEAGMAMVFTGRRHFRH